jgi:hypothetical protein
MFWSLLQCKGWFTQKVRPWNGWTLALQISHFPISYTFYHQAFKKDVNELFWLTDCFDMFSWIPRLNWVGNSIFWVPQLKSRITDFATHLLFLMIFALKAPLFHLCEFYRQRVSVVVQCTQVVSILKRAVVDGEGSSRLGLFSRGPPLSLFDMFLATGRG